jgi:hypothetical protein
VLLQCQHRQLQMVGVVFNYEYQLVVVHGCSLACDINFLSVLIILLFLSYYQVTRKLHYFGVADFYQRLVNR